MHTELMVDAQANLNQQRIARPDTVLWTLITKALLININVADLEQKPKKRGQPHLDSSTSWICNTVAQLQTMFAGTLWNMLCQPVLRGGLIIPATASATLGVV